MSRLRSTPGPAATLLFALALGLAVAGCGNEPPAEAPSEEPAAGPRIVCDEDGLVYLGERITGPVPRETLRRLLGPPDRSVALANDIDTWDERGLLAYAYSGEPTYHTLHVELQPEEYDFSPKKVYGGILVLNGATITAATPGSGLVAAGLDKDASLSFFYQGTVGPFLVTAETREGGGGATSLQVDLVP